MSAEIPEVTIIKSRDGKRMVELSQDPGGQFRFAQFDWRVCEGEDIALIGEGYWVLAEQSGLYATPEAAEMAAWAAVDWLRDGGAES